MAKGLKLIEIWGGIECTINRVNNFYFDQLDFSGHYSRERDIELFAELGIKKLRYPILWERHKPTKNTEINWSHTEKNLLRLKQSGIEPIAGLIHHGSGPEYASIETEDFAPGLAEYAAQVAQKFPWINYYTPVNEPLTTARFCGLYGHWHPHQKDNLSFLRLLINECKATILAMQAIRRINPLAKLIQTEDLSKTYSSPLLHYQAEFENHRRWLGFDLIMGKVNKDHALWSYLMWAGISESDLAFFEENNYQIDILGFNYYPTSERFLDENIVKYPAHTHGGNHLHNYADVEAVRVDLEDDDYGINVLLLEAWKLYNIPIVVSEVHLGCTRDEQMRWINDIHSTCYALKEKGVNILAITAWAMLGTFGWNKLVTDTNALYEPGLFDLRSKYPRPTALTKMLKSLSNGIPYQHPVLEEKGWWKKDIRILYFQNNVRRLSKETKTSQPLLIIGKTGTLGRAYARLCELRGIHYKLLGREEIDLTNKKLIEKVIKKERPWAIINAAGYVQVDNAEAFSTDCFKINTYGPANLASFSRKYNFKLITFSSDLVFDGIKNMYTEFDRVAPLNIYGKSKALAEKLVLEQDPSALVIRTSAFFGPWDHYNFANNVLNTLQSGSEFIAANDIFISPTYVPDLVNVSLDLLLDDESGIWHLANQGNVTWSGFAEKVATQAGFNTSLIIPVPNKRFNLAAIRPRYSVLHSEKALIMPSLNDAISRYFNEQEVIDFSLPVIETA